MEGFEDYREDYDSMKPEELREQLANLSTARDAHPEYLIHQEWTALWRSFDIYSDNMAELRALLDAAETNEELQMELFQNVRPQTVRAAYFRGVDRMLHNALAGAISLVDHARRHVAENFENTEFSREFETRNSAVFELPEAAFLRRFRNYLLHVGHAPFRMTGAFASASEQKGTLTVWLDSEQPLSVGKIWTEPARIFIESNPDGLHLLAVFDVYGQAMLDLYGWMFDQQRVLRPHGLDILNEFTRRVNLTMSRGAHDGRHMTEYWEHVARNAKAQDEGRPQVSWQDVRPTD